MNITIKNIAAVITIFLFTFCAEKKPETAVAELPSAPEPAKPQALALENPAINAIYPHYIDLSKALVKGDAVAAGISAMAIESGTIAQPELNGINRSAGKISSENNLDHQRIEFSKLSGEMITSIKKSGIKTGQLFVDFCPMAMNNKGAYWLSAEKIIENPYYGEMMKNCGEVKETLD